MVQGCVTACDRLRFKVHSVVKARYSKVVKGGDLNADDLKLADITWVRSVQACSFAIDRQTLVRGTEGNQRVREFNLYIDVDGILRCKGRLNNADIPQESKNPVLLPARHGCTELLIRERHGRVHHNGVTHTLNSIRETHWVLRGREAVKRVVRKCTICRRFEGKPFTAAPPPDLPTDRVCEGPPFTYTGIHFACPLYISNSLTGQQEKAYCCLLSCASTRAIHLELTESLTVASFL